MRESVVGSVQLRLQFGRVLSHAALAAALILSALDTTATARPLLDSFRPHTQACTTGTGNSCSQQITLDLEYEETESPKGYGPSELREAYALPEKGGSGQTVAIIIPGDDPNAESDMNAFRSPYGLGACTTTSGCFTKVDWKGGTSYPAASTSMPEDVKAAREISLDLDMVSVACQECHILLVEAPKGNKPDLYSAVDEAVKLGANEVSLSWEDTEQSGAKVNDKHFEYAGIPVVAASGDYGYNNYNASVTGAPSYPASISYKDLVAVGGTTLDPAKNARKWIDTVWPKTGSGCSVEQVKPVWQTLAGCTNRLTNDVSIVAENARVYDTWGTTDKWSLMGGTSVGAPLIAGLLAHASQYVKEHPNKAFYKDLKEGLGTILDVIPRTGKNNTNYPGKTCTNHYECNAEAGTDGDTIKGYDGPTGVGVPQGMPTLPSWRATPMPARQGTLREQLFRVSCYDSEGQQKCLAVGDAMTPELPSFSEPYWVKSVAVYWDGEKWQREAPPYITGPLGTTQLFGVSCYSATQCIAVGGEVVAEAGVEEKAVAARWNAGSWTSETIGTEGIPFSVACIGTSFCMAAGSNFGGTALADRWNGSSWLEEVAALPSGASAAGFRSVACPASNICIAAGWYTLEEKEYPLLEKWNGSAWTVVSPGSLPESTELNGVACAAVEACTVVGGAATGPVALRWDEESWNLEAPPIPPGDENATLEGVSCSTTTSCIAVGVGSGGAGRGVFDSWDGTAWESQEAAPHSGTHFEPWGISCDAPGKCLEAGTEYAETTELNISLGGDRLAEPETPEAEAGPPNSPEPSVANSTGGNPGAPGLQLLVRGGAVNCGSGDESTSQTDDVISGRGLGLSVVRSYDAQTAAAAQAEGKASGGWGWGWVGPYGSHLVFGTAESGQETVTVVQQDGSAVVFYAKEGGGFEEGAWVQARLAKEGSDYVYTLPDQTKLEFSGEGRLLKESDRSGNATTVTYNGSKQIETVTDATGRTLTFKYNGEGLVESIKDPLGHVVSYTYVAKGGLSTVNIEGKVRWEYEYTTSAPYLLKGVTDGRGHTITREYDSSHRVTKEVIGGHERKWSYAGNETTITEPNGSVTVATFNSAEEPTKVIEAQGTGSERTTEYEYDGTTFNLTKLTDPNKHSTEYQYDEEGNRTSEKDPSGDERKWEYDQAHDAVKETTPEGEVTKTKLTETGLPEVVERPAGSETQKTEYKHDAYGDVTEETNPLGNKTKYTYDSNGDKNTEKDAEGDERKWKYNEDSQETEETSPRGYVTKTERNNYGLPTKITDPLGHSTEIKYDANQNNESETDGRKHTTKYEYNEENLPTKATKPNGDTTETGYDSEGKKTSYTDGNGHTWEYKRNKLEQVIEEKNPLGKTWKKTYDKAGNPETLEDPEEHVTTDSYDESNRLTKTKYSTGHPSEVTYEYNKDGKVTKMKDETGTTENTWDKLDRLTKYKNGAGKTVEYEYNLANLPVKITYPNGKSITREYDKADRLAKVTDWKSHATTFKYNGDSKLTTITFPSESEDKDEYAYNEADQMTEALMLWKGSVDAGAVYERDADGQVTKTIQKFAEGKEPETATSVLDEDNRLTEYNGHAYTYDKGNNPTKIEGTAGYTYNEADQLKESPAAKYKYNEDGQRTQLEPKTGEPATTYTWDQAGNLTNLAREKGAKQTEVNEATSYDANGLAQQLTLNGTKYKTAWDTIQPQPVALEDESNTGEEEASFIYGPENLPFEEAFGANSIYFHHDQQDSTRLVTYWQHGEIVGWKSYGPYGNTTETAGDPTSLAYNGQPTDPETGLVWFGTRRYDTNTAQYLSPDPALEGTDASYNYAQNNPENTHTKTPTRHPESSSNP